MEQQKATTLQTQILAVNTIKEHCKMIIEYEVEKMAAMIGKDPFKVDGSFKQKFDFPRLLIEKKKVNAFGFDFWVDTHYYHTVEYGKYQLVVITTVHGGGYDKNGINLNHSQQKKYIDLFKYENNTITERAEMNLDFLDVQYNESEILSFAAEVERVAQQYEKALSKVPHHFRDALYLRRLR